MVPTSKHGVGSVMVFDILGKDGWKLDSGQGYHVKTTKYDYILQRHASGLLINEKNINFQ